MEPCCTNEPKNTNIQQFHVTRVKSSRGSGIRRNSTRAQGNNPNTNPFHNETGLILVTGRNNNSLLMHLTRDATLCKNHTIIGKPCTHEGRKISIGLHITFKHLSEPEKLMLRNWIITSRALSCPRTGN